MNEKLREINARIVGYRAGLHRAYCIALVLKAVDVARELDYRHEASVEQCAALLWSVSEMARVRREMSVPRNRVAS